MRVLFLDDMPERWNAFFNRVKRPGVTVDWALTAEGAIDALNETPQDGEYSHVFLDHDLDPGAYAGSPQEKTGMDVVDFIVRHAHAFKGTQFYVHSLNEPAAMRMTAALQDADLRVLRRPFAWLYAEIKEA